MRLILGTVLCCCLGLSEASQRRPLFKWDDVNFLLAFGDSYTYVQGTAGRNNYSFIGDVQNFAFTPETLLTDRITQNQVGAAPGGTSSGGPNWVKYLTGCFSGLPSKCRTQLWDFAFAGANTATELLPLHHDYTISFEEQINQWSTYAKPVLPVKLSKALVAIWIGINDINDHAKLTSLSNNATDFPSFYAKLTEAEFNAVGKVYDAGFRNFLFLNLPPLERNPKNQASLNPLPSKTMVNQYNSAIAAAATKFAASHPGANAMVFDTHTYLSGILDDPSKYGIKNTTSYCPRSDAPDIDTNHAAYGCAPIQDYFWYNSGHITWPIHRFLAKEVERFLKKESR